MPQQAPITKVVIIFLGFIFIWPSAAAASENLLISQVQITGGPGKTTNDFVEIYNPTDHDIDLAGMRLVKRTKTGDEDTLLKSWTSSIAVKSHGYYLWANSDFADIGAAPDVTTSGSIANDNGVAVRNGPNDAGEIVDGVAWGEAANVFVEGAVFPTNPDAGQSIERNPGGSAGNGEDANNNSQDFFLQSASHPRNSQSPVQPPIENPAPPPAPPPSSPSPAPIPSTSGGSASLAVEFSEILPNPRGKDSGFEWIEVYNSGTAAADLSGWYADDGQVNETLRTSALKIAASTPVAPGQFALISIPAGKFALNNADGDGLRLFDADKNLKASLFYAGPAKEGYGYAKNGQGGWAWTETPTPSAANVFAAPAVFANLVRISEVLPDPEGDDAEEEYIEIQNYGTDSVDLADWVVADSRKKYTISEEDFLETELSAGGFLVLYREVTGISLNNTGTEEVRLFNPAGEQVDRLAFEAKSKQGQSYSRAANGLYEWTAKISPGTVNQIVQSEAKFQDRPSSKISAIAAAAVPEINLAEVRKLPVGTKVKTSGVVAVSPDLLGENIIYLQGSGIRVALKGDHGILQVGDEIEAEGEIAESHRELYLEVDSRQIKILGSDREVAAHDLKTVAVGEETEGYLVKITGTVVENQGDTFFVDDSTGRARVYLRDSASIEKPKFKIGDKIQVTGIVSQYDENYRILPRQTADIVMMSAAGQVAGAITGKSLPRTGIDFWLILAIFSAITNTFIFVLPSKSQETCRQAGKSL